ncbi:MAG: hypothetical protein DHS20C18_03120 [Saprospiraceae bacterium]|nr:MAG: hypothetical protein DHS20C18_03120 [Saprospiraceae bacterium]
MRLVYDLINLIFYSNLWIALAALALSVQTQWLLTNQLQWSPLWGVIFFGTLFLYALHRLIGIRKVSFSGGQTRFEIFEKFKWHLLTYALLSAFAGGYFFLQLEITVIGALFLPCLISLLYVLPIFPSGKRGRDFSFLKIFLIAFSWAWITVLLPAIDLQMSWIYPIYLIFLERMFFIFAIALPFDIRDIKVDQYNKVKTIPTRFGIYTTKRITGVVLLFMMGMVLLNYQIDAYSAASCVALCLSAIQVFVLVYLSDRYQHDYFFSGLIDGAMILQFILVIIFNGLFA